MEKDSPQPHTAAASADALPVRAARATLAQLGVEWPREPTLEAVRRQVEWLRRARFFDEDGGGGEDPA